MKTEGNENGGARFSDQSGAPKAACLVLKWLNNSLPWCARIAGSRRKTQESPGTFCQSREEIEQNTEKEFDDGAIEMQCYLKAWQFYIIYGKTKNLSLQATGEGNTHD